MDISDHTDAGDDEYEYEYEYDSEEEISSHGGVGGSGDGDAPAPERDHDHASVAPRDSADFPPPSSPTERSSTEDSLLMMGSHARSPCTCDAARAEAAMRSAVSRAADLLCVPPVAALAVLRHFGWDERALSDQYFGNEGGVWDACGVRGRCGGGAGAAAPKRARSSLACPVCFDGGLGPGDVFALPCGHAFCRSCWGGYLESAATEGPRCVFTRCPDPSCRELVTEEEVAELAPSVLDKFRQFQLRSFVETSRSMRWCPGPSCERVVVASTDGFEGETMCKCGTTFCLACGETSHTPASCETLAGWSKKCVDESENANWILVNTKNCPKCDVRIEKNQGCNHMTCRGCTHEFCWLCLADWKKHPGCNEYSLKALEEAKSEISVARAELERYLHCYNRFHSHSVGQAFSEDQLRAFLRKLEEREDGRERPEDRIFRNALEQLIECRRVLKYSFAVAFYLEDGSSDKALFEDHQKLLESFTERLSGLTERKFVEIDQRDLMNMTGAVKQFVKNVLAGGPY